MSFYDYRVLGKFEKCFPISDEGPGSTTYTDHVEVKTTEIETWYGMDEHFALYILYLQLTGDLDLPPDKDTHYIIERKLSGSHAWEVVRTVWKEPSPGELPEGFQSFDDWIYHYEKRRSRQ